VGVLPFLRIIGIANAALWFGASLFFLVCIRGVFQSEELMRLVPHPFSEASMHVLLGSYLTLLTICSLVAMGQHWAEQWYAGRPVFQLKMGVLLTLVVVNMVIKWVIFPSMTQQHLRAYRPSATQQDLQEGARAYRMWKTGFHFVHLFVVIGSFSHLMSVTQRHSSYRELGMYQFRG
jgi:hypothetical protein